MVTYFQNMIVFTKNATIIIYCELVLLIESFVKWFFLVPTDNTNTFLDCTEWCEENGVGMDELERAAWDVGVAVQDGRAFHGSHHLRMNLALPFSRVQEAFRRLEQYVFVKK